MVILTENIVQRYASSKRANTADRIESVLRDLGKSRLSMDFGLLHNLLEDLSHDTRLVNPEISHQTEQLAKVFKNTHENVTSEVLEAIDATRALLETAVF